MTDLDSVEEAPSDVKRRVQGWIVMTPVHYLRAGAGTLPVHCAPDSKIPVSKKVPIKQPLRPRKKKET